MAKAKVATQKKKYLFLPHTADSKFRAFGKTLEKKFENAALAMASIMFNCSKIKPAIKKKIAVKGADLKALLYNWIEELLYLVDAKGFILNSVKQIKIKKEKKGFSLVAEVAGDKYKRDYDKVATGTDVKAVTYQQMEITPSYVQVVVDV
jgi:SHS2 domain-containing protein